MRPDMVSLARVSTVIRVLQRRDLGVRVFDPLGNDDHTMLMPATTPLVSSPLRLLFVRHVTHRCRCRCCLVVSSFVSRGVECGRLHTEFLELQPRSVDCHVLG